MIIMRKTTDTQIIRTAIVKAIAKQQPVTISYTSASGRDIVRTVEPYALTQSKAGDTLVKTMDREAGDYRSFRLDRISAYTVHRTYFLIKNPTNAKDVVMAKDSGAPVSKTPTDDKRHPKCGPQTIPLYGCGGTAYVHCLQPKGHDGRHTP